MNPSTNSRPTSDPPPLHYHGLIRKGSGPETSFLHNVFVNSLPTYLIFCTLTQRRRSSTNLDNESKKKKG